jgi:hypothetical protein
MLSFYHIKVLAARRANQQRRQGPQCREVDTGDVSHLPRAVGRRFEHPARDLLYREQWLPEDCAADHGRAVSGAHGPDAHLASVPGVPRVADFQHVGIVGAPSLGCTIRAGLTRRWTARPPIWFTSPRCLSLRRRNVTRAELHLPRLVCCPTLWGHRIDGAPNASPAPIQDVRVDHRRLDVSVTKQLLISPDVVSALLGMRREGMPGSIVEAPVSMPPHFGVIGIASATVDVANGQ